MIPPYRLRIPKGFVVAFSGRLGALARESTPDRKLHMTEPLVQLYMLVTEASRNYTLLIAATTHLEVDVPRELMGVLPGVCRRIRQSSTHDDPASYASFMDWLIPEIDEEAKKTFIDLIGEIR